MIIPNSHVCLRHSQALGPYVAVSKLLWTLVDYGWILSCNYACFSYVIRKYTEHNSRMKHFHLWKRALEWNRGLWNTEIPKPMWHWQLPVWPCGLRKRNSLQHRKLLKIHCDEVWTKQILLYLPKIVCSETWLLCILTMLVLWTSVWNAGFLTQFGINFHFFKTFSIINFSQWHTQVKYKHYNC